MPQLTNVLKSYIIESQGHITYYTDTICFIYREGYYFHLGKTDKSEFIIRKNKFGPCSKTILKWKYAFMKFYEQTN